MVRQTLLLLVTVGILASLTMTWGTLLLLSHAAVTDNALTTGTVNVAASPAVGLVTFSGTVLGEQVAQPLTITRLARL